MLGKQKGREKATVLVHLVRERESESESESESEIPFSLVPTGTATDSLSRVSVNQSLRSSYLKSKLYISDSEIEPWIWR
jgi:hypothetical protein